MISTLLGVDEDEEAVLRFWDVLWTLPTTFTAGTSNRVSRALPAFSGCGKFSLPCFCRSGFESSSGYRNWKGSGNGTHESGKWIRGKGEGMTTENVGYSFHHSRVQGDIRVRECGSIAESGRNRSRRRTTRAESGSSIIEHYRCQTCRIEAR